MILQCLFFWNLFKNLNLCTSYIKQIMNVFSFVQWKKYFHSVKDEMYIQLGFASLNGTFHLSPHENICTIALINIHYLYTMKVERNKTFKNNRKIREIWAQNGISCKCSNNFLARARRFITNISFLSVITSFTTCTNYTLKWFNNKLKLFKCFSRRWFIWSSASLKL